jgi:hypothetical protein
MLATAMATPKRGRGRPRTTGAGLTVGVRLHADLIGALDAWIASRTPAVSRPEAIRVILANGLSKED